VDITEAFDTLQKNVNAPMSAVERARERRNLFRTAFEPESDVEEVWCSHPGRSHGEASATRSTTSTW
jgi:hypothetical protein